MQISAPGRPRLPALTSIRFFAALWVALFHMGAMRAYTLPAAVLRRVASIGYCGVSFFFVLSGFILVYTYAGRETGLRAFWQARFARIYPALVFALLVTGPGFLYCCVQMRAHNPQLFVPEWAWSAQHLPLTVAANLLLLQSWLPQLALSWNMPGWSLSVEAFFYLLFPFLLPWMMRRSARALVGIAAAGFGAVLLGTLVYTHVAPDGAITLRTLGPWMNTVKFNPLVRLPEFVMGMVTGLVFLRSDRRPRIAWPMILAGVALTAGVVVWSDAIPYVVLHTALMGPVFAVLVYGMALEPAGLGFLGTPVMEALGEASYPFYLLHSMIIGAFFLDFRTQQAKHQSLLGFVLWLVIAIAVSVLVDRGIERPLRRLMRPRRTVPVRAVVQEARA